MNDPSEKSGTRDAFVENMLAENAAFKRKLQSKAEALLILSKELDQCRSEREQFKLMAEQLQNRCSLLKKQKYTGELPICNYLDYLGSQSKDDSLVHLLHDAKEQNKALQFCVDQLRQKLKDSEGDIKLLREQLGQHRTTFLPGSSSQDTARNFSYHQKEELVQQLEILKMKCVQLEADLQSVLDEKEERAMERDAYKCKVHRLNHIIHVLLKGESKYVIDVDSLLMENRYLQERLQQVQEEKNITQQNLQKYKSMLEKKRSRGSVRLGTNNSVGLVMTHKQVQQLLQKGGTEQLPSTTATMEDLTSLCLALLESLNDKTLAVSHQRKANKILAGRVTELEKSLTVLEGGEMAAFPSQYLLQGYSSADVDKEMEHIMLTLEDAEKAVSRSDQDKNSEDVTDGDSDKSVNELQQVFRLDSLNSSEDSNSDHLQEYTERDIIKPPHDGTVGNVSFNMDFNIQFSPSHKQTSSEDVNSTADAEKCSPVQSDNIKLTSSPSAKIKQAVNNENGIVSPQADRLSWGTQQQLRSTPAIGTEKDDDLPPDLKKLVQEALDDLNKNKEKDSLC